MPLRPISDIRLTAGTLWTAQHSFDFMERTWQVFELPFDWECGTFTATASTPGPSTGTATHDVYGVFPESYDLDANFAEGMYLELTVYAYVTHGSGGIASLKFTGADTAYGGLVSAYRKATKTWTTGFPTGIQTLELTLTTNSKVVPSPEPGQASVSRSWGSGPDSYLRIIVPDAAGVDTDDVVLVIGDESELPTPSATWRGARAYLKAATGINVQDKSWYCMKGYDDNYYWVPFVMGGGGL